MFMTVCRITLVRLFELCIGALKERVKKHAEVPASMWPVPMI